MLNVVFASDDNYTSLLKVAILSLLENNSENFDKINIFVLDDGISEDNKTKIYEIIKDYNCSILFIETKKLDKLNINIMTLKRGHLNKSSLTTYARLFLSTLIPKNIDKIIYLDCDSLIMDSLQNLWTMDISNYYCAAVNDGINTAIKEKLGFKKGETYINAGFLLINLKKWREDNVEEQFIEFMIENQKRFYQHDQGVLNNVFKNKIKIITPHYNLQNYYQTLNYDMARKYSCMETEYYTKKIVEDARKNPIFLHFCGPNYDRPWYNKEHPYAKLFKKYAEKSDSQNVIEYLTDLPLKAKLFYKGINNKLIYLLLKAIPNKLVIKIINRNALKEFEAENKKAALTFKR